jgi:hypothetical protein
MGLAFYLESFSRADVVAISGYRFEMHEKLGNMKVYSIHAKQNCKFGTDSG